MKSIKSKIIGELIQDVKFPDWWEIDNVYIQMIEKNINTIFMDFVPEFDTHFVEEADIALKNFLELKIDYKNEISDLIYNEFIDFCSMVSENDIPSEMKGIKANQIWDFVKPSCLYVTRRPYNDKGIYLNLTCECNWEEEHGLQLVFKNGLKLTRVSTQDGHLTDADAFDIPDSEDKLLSAY